MVDSRQKDRMWVMACSVNNPSTDMASGLVEMYRVSIASLFNEGLTALPSSLPVDRMKTNQLKDGAILTCSSEGSLRKIESDDDWAIR